MDHYSKSVWKFQAIFRKIFLHSCASMLGRGQSIYFFKCQKMSFIPDAL